ncbi:tensin-like isoform X2, partial [Paramuricea clavata]
SFTPDKRRFSVAIENGLEVRGDILVKCSHKSITSAREIIFRCQFHTGAVENNFLRLEKSQLDEAHKGEVGGGGGDDDDDGGSDGGDDDDDGGSDGGDDDDDGGGSDGGDDVRGGRSDDGDHVGGSDG